MTNNKKINTTGNIPAIRTTSNNTTHPAIKKRVSEFFAAAILTTASTGFMLTAPAISSAAPSSHASTQAHTHAADTTLPEPALSKRDNTEAWARGRILVMPRAGLPAQALANILKEHDGKARKIGQSDLYIVDLPEYTEEGVIARLAHHPHLKFAELDYYVSPTLTPNDPYYSNGWHLPKIGTPLAWDDSQGANITIAVLDTGVDSNHPDLSAKMVSGWNFYDNNSNTADVQGHGTKVAGAAAAATNNSIGVSGIAGQSKIMPIRVADSNGWGTWSAIAQGLTWAADRGARVANLSFLGVTSSSSARSSAQYMKNKGGLVVVSGGNTGALESYPATTTMIPVSATDSNNNRTSWSSYGNYIALAAPGAGIWTTIRGGSYGGASGTSLSSPVTAGVIALMMAANPVMKNTDIEKTLFSTALDLGASGWDPYYGYGRVDAAAAVQAVITSSPSVDREAPAVTILDPLSGETVSGLVPVDVEASDNIGVTRTELWVNNTSVAVDSTAPFAFTWDSTGSANGPTSLVVRAFDAAGNATISNTVDVNVDNPINTEDSNSNSSSPTGTTDTQPPVVQIINPVAGNVSHNVTITVNASDNNGAAGISLSIYVDDAIIASGTGSTLSTNWNTRPKRVDSGLHKIEARAVDAAGNAASDSVTANVVK